MATLSSAPAAELTRLRDRLDGQVAPDAALAAALLAIDPAGLGGAVIAGDAGPAREAWLRWLRACLPADAPLRRLPLHIADERLLGGLDLAATLAAGRPVQQRGLLMETDGGVLAIGMAERLPGSLAARLCAAMDAAAGPADDGSDAPPAARFGIVAFEEARSTDEAVPAALADRLALRIEIEPASPYADAQRASGLELEVGDVAAARARLPGVRVDDATLQALCAAAFALGIDSLRAPLLALRVARAAAALFGRDQVHADDAALAARLVLAARATTLPVPLPGDSKQRAPEPHPDLDADAAADANADADADADAPASDAAEPPEQPSPPAGDDEPSDGRDESSDHGDVDVPSTSDGPLEDAVLAAAVAAVPAGLLASLGARRERAARVGGGGRAGATAAGGLRGRPTGVRPGLPGTSARLNLVETLRAAAPWQALRRREAAAAGRSASDIARVQVRRDDFRVTRFATRRETATLFVVDASGSAALHRLAEAKGAVEMLLADCYVRRDSVALIAFRGRSAELLLPPTRSLVRARRSLAGLPGGGGTPLAAALDAALALSDAVRRKGQTPVVVLLTDGRANIALDGSAGRERAAADARDAARRLRAAGTRALWLDTSPLPQPAARELAVQLGATYLPLPHADAALLSGAVRAAAGIAGQTR